MNVVHHLSLRWTDNIFDVLPGESIKKFAAMLARGMIVNIQLSPFVSMKSWRVMAVGSMWCSRNGRMKAWNGGKFIF